MSPCWAPAPVYELLGGRRRDVVPTFASATSHHAETAMEQGRTTPLAWRSITKEGDQSGKVTRRNLCHVFLVMSRQFLSGLTSGALKAEHR